MQDADIDDCEDAKLERHLERCTGISTPQPAKGTFKKLLILD